METPSSIKTVTITQESKELGVQLHISLLSGTSDDLLTMTTSLCDSSMETGVTWIELISLSSLGLTRSPEKPA